MRDLLWTIIIIWLLYKVVEIFKGFSAKKQDNSFSGQSYEHSQRAPGNSGSNKKDIRGALRKHLNNEGEYIDYEEVK